MVNSQKIAILIIILVLGMGGTLWYFSQRSAEKPSYPGPELKAPEVGEIPSEVAITNMKIGSPAFFNNQSIPAKYTCDGEDVNPLLSVSDVPDGAKSLVLIVDDPDAPRGTWVHWTVWNIAPETPEIAEDSVPEGSVEGMTDFGRPGYGGPCPPSGTHRYFFKLYVLDVALNLAPSAKAADIEKAMEGHILERAELVGLYKRK